MKQVSPSEIRKLREALLVTGAAGFVGYHLAAKFLTEGRQVVGMDNLNSYHDVILKEGRLGLLQQRPRFLSGAYTRARCNWHGIEAGAGVRIAASAILSRKAGGAIRLGNRCQIHPGAMLLTYGGDITIDDDVTVNPYTILYGHGGLKIDKGVRIAAHVVIIPANHQVLPDRFILQQPETRVGIVIADDVWIGAGARILDGVTLAHGTVIGAGAVVSRSTESFGIYAGVPARKLGDRRSRPGVS